MSSIESSIEKLYSSLPIATALFYRDDDGNWLRTWQNASAESVWGHFDIDHHPLFKIEMIDALSKVVTSTFDFPISNAVENYQFIATPIQEKFVLVQFFVKPASAEVTPEKGSDLYPKVIKSAGLGVFDWNLEEDQIRFNQRVYDIFGISSAQLGHSYQEMLAFIHPEDIDSVKDAIEEHLDTDWPLKVEFRVIDHRNQHQWISMRGQAEWDGSLPIRLTGSLEDISERKHTELELKQREALIEQMIDALPISIYVKDAQGCYRFFNAEAETQNNMLRNQLIGRTDYEVYPMPASLKKAEVDKTIQQSERLSIFENETDDGNGWLLIGKVPIRVLQPNKPYETWLLSFSLDITERKQMEEELKEARAIAEDAAKAKASFLSIMSHEIRTPLNSVIGNAGLLLSERLDENLAEHVEMIKRSGEHLLYLINDILDFNKLDAGKVELDLSPFDIRQQVNTVIEMSATNAKLKNIYLKSNISDELHEHYLGDDGRLRQVLLNLVGNALKFTTEGGVIVNVTLSKMSNNVRFEVVDTGIGIAESNIPKLFSEFSQAESSTSKNYGGTGLGLAISKKLVEAMNGRIGIESKEGEGSTFWFEIPFTPAKSEESSGLVESVILADVENLSILVAEDNLPNQFLIKSILTKLGHRVIIANNGLEAVQSLEQPENEFDLVLMDMQMPEMDGLEATRKIRSGSVSPIREIPIVALTANAYEDVYETVIAIGMNDCLTKPINIDQLKQVLNKWARSSER